MPFTTIDEFTDKEKAAVIVGMVRGFEKGCWPQTFTDIEKKHWLLMANYSAQMLTGGTFNPFYVFDVRKHFDKEFN